MCFRLAVCIPSYSERSNGVPFLQKIFVPLTALPLHGFEVIHPMPSKTLRHVRSLDMSMAHAQQLTRAYNSFTRRSNDSQQ